MRALFAYKREYPSLHHLKKAWRSKEHRDEERTQKAFHNLSSFILETSIPTYKGASSKCLFKAHHSKTYETYEIHMNTMLHYPSEIAMS